METMIFSTEQLKQGTNVQPYSFHVSSYNIFLALLVVLMKSKD